MKIRRPATDDEKLEMNMTPMIDVCFQLIIFFMLSLRLYSPEGDFNIKMPLAGPSAGKADFDQLPLVHVRLSAGADGRLAGIHMNQRPLADFDQLRGEIRDLVRDAAPPGSAGPSLKVELDCDPNLKYEYTMRAITAISGYVAADGRTVKLVEKIRFTPRRK